MKKRYLIIVWAFIAFFCVNNLSAQYVDFYVDGEGESGIPESGTCAPAFVHIENASYFSGFSPDYHWRLTNHSTGDLVDSYEFDFQSPDTILMPGNYELFLEADTMSVSVGFHSYSFSIEGSMGIFDILPDSNICPNESFSVGYNFDYKSIKWDFGDGTQLASYNWPKHVYEDTGIHSITLFLETECGIDTITQTITVSDTLTPNVEISVLGPGGEGSCPYDKVYFDCNYEEDHVQSYLWDFGDGFISADKAPVHRYSKEGEDTVKLTITNLCGNKGTHQTIMYINSGNGYASSYFTYEFEGGGCPNDIVNFSSEGFCNCLWNFGDGTTSTDFNPQHFYSEEGEYPVKLSVSNNCGIFDSMEQIINVAYNNQYNIPYANISFENQDEYVDSITVCPNEEIFFRNNSDDGDLLYKWDMDYNDIFLYDRDISFSYPEAGEYWVKMTVYNNCNAQSVDSVFVNVDYDAIPISHLRVIPETICTGEKAMFYNVISEIGADDYTYDVWFGDGDSLTNITEPNDDLLNGISHIYDKEGTFDYTFKVTNSCGNSDSIKGKLIVDNDIDREPWYYIENSSGNHDGETKICQIAQDSIIFLKIQDSIATIGTIMGEDDPMPNIVSVSSFVDEGYGLFTFNADGEGCEVEGQYEYYSESESGEPIVFNPYYQGEDLCTERKALLNGENQFFTTDDGEKSVCPGDPVDFTIVGGQSYEWHFGDGSETSTEQFPSHAYADTGTYKAYCIATNSAARIDTIYTTVLINSNNLPDALFELSDYENVYVNDTVYFQAQVDEDQGEHYNYVWDFGDGSTNLSGTKLFHIFNQPGDYTVTLTLSNSCSYSKASKNVYVDSESGTCSAFYTYFPNMANKSVQFNDESEGDNITDYQWNFGDGETSNEKNPYHVYADFGFYNVCLTVFDSNSGYSDEFCENIPLVNDTTSACNASYDYEINDKQVAFFNSSLGSITNYLWTFDDGHYSYAINPVHDYDAPGFYNVCLSVYNSTSGNMNEYCENIVVTDASQVACNANFSSFNNGLDVSFTDKSIGNITNYLWDFGDGAYSYTKNPSHHYYKHDYYPVTLYIYDDASGCMDEFYKVVAVSDSTQAMCNANYEFYSKGDSVIFTNTSEGNITDYFWDFEDGGYSFDVNPTHVYDNPGYYLVNLTSYDAESNCLSNYSNVVSVVDTTQENCNARFNFFTEENTVSFTADAVGTYTNLFWDFDDGYNSNQLNPIHTYKNTGYYNVTFAIFDTTTNCFDTKDKIVYVDGESTSNQCKANFSYYPNNTTLDVQFSDKSYGNPIAWYWDFGDNSLANDLQDPVYKYSEAGYYRVSLTITNETGNQKSISKYIAVGDVSNSSTSYFTYLADSVTSTAYFKNKSLGNISSYSWDFGDGYTSVQKNPSHTYQDTGYYAVCLKTVSESNVTKIFCNDVRIGNALANPCLYSCVWPGDANSDLEANHYDIMTIGLNYGLTGPKREDASLLWIGQFSQNWSTYQLDGTNNKYGDCNGDGVIDAADTLAIYQNFAYSHYYQPNSKAGNDWVLSCGWDSTKVGANKARVRLSRPSSKAESDIYAIGYEITVKGGEGIIFNETKVNFNGSWLGTDGDDLLSFYQLDSVKQKIYIGVSRIDHKDTTGEGDITNLYFEFKDGYGPENFSFDVTTQGGIVSSGENVQVGGELTLFLGADKSICEGDTVTLDAGEGFASYLWSTGETNSQISVSEAGTYSVKVTDETSIVSSDTVKVVVNPIPTVEIGEAYESADSVILDAGSGFIEYLWSDGTTQQTMIAKHTNHYSVTVTDENGCMGVDTAYVHILGISQQANDVNLIVFPNPNKGIFKLFLNSNSNDDLVLQLINIQGQIVYLKSVTNVKDYKAEINVSNLPTGIYYMKVNKGSMFKVQRIVIN